MKVEKIEFNDVKKGDLILVEDMYNDKFIGYVRKINFDNKWKRKIEAEVNKEEQM